MVTMPDTAVTSTCCYAGHAAGMPSSRAALSIRSS
jgi:hypothetical protein